MNRALFTVGAVLSGLFVTEAQAQSAWHLGLVGAAARSGVSDRGSLALRLEDSSVPLGEPIVIHHRQKNAATYHVGLQISRDLTPRLTLELEPRYSRLASEVRLEAGPFDNPNIAYGRVLGGMAQLPVGLRWRATRPGPVALHLLGRLVPGLAQTGPAIAGAARYGSLELRGAGLHGQLGLEGGVGVLIRERVGLNLLVQHGFALTRLAQVSGRVPYVSSSGTSYAYYRVDGFFDGHLNAVSFQAVAYFN